jgi:hypothetical protein
MGADGLDGAGPIAIDLDGYGTLQEGDGSDETEAVLEGDDDAFDTGEGAVLDADFLADGEERVGFDVPAEAQHGLDGEDLFVGDGGEKGAEGDDAGDAGGFEDGDAVGGMEAAEDVAGEERHGEFLSAVGPAAAGTDEREELLVALGLEVGGGEAFTLGAAADGVPFRSGGGGRRK